MKRPKRGRCAKCSCTERRACVLRLSDGSSRGCSWRDGEQTMCDACFASHDVALVVMLRDLRKAFHKAWWRPMDLGARDGSHHSATLKKLAGFGLVHRRRRNTLMNELRSARGSYEYRAA